MSVIETCETCGRSARDGYEKPRQGDHSGEDLMEWCAQVIEGMGGMLDWQVHEWVVFDPDYDDRTHAAAFVLRCLANPRCEGSQKVLDLIAGQRATCGQGER